MKPVEEIQTMHDWIVLLYQAEHAYSVDFALGMEMAVASHLNGVHKLALRTGGFFHHPDTHKDIQRAQGYDYGCLVTEQLSKLNPALYEELQRAFPFSTALHAKHPAY